MAASRKPVNIDLDYLFSSYELADRFLDIVELRQMPCKITRYARVRMLMTTLARLGKGERLDGSIAKRLKHGSFDEC